LPGRLIAYGLRHYGARISVDVTFNPPILFHNFADRSIEPFSNLVVGKGCYLGREILLDLKEKITIEDFATLAMGVTIVTHTDVARSPLKESLVQSTQSPVTIRQGAYLAARSTVLQGVEIGECAVVAAGALVNKSVPKYAVYGGIPAREIGILQRN